MKHFSELDLKKNISIWASGPSKEKISLVDREKIKLCTTSIGINFFRLFKPAMRFWLDGRVSQWLDTQNTEDTILVTRPSAFLKVEEKKLPIRYKIDYWFDNSVENKKDYWRDGNYTLWMLMLMLRHYFPDKEIYLFGVDCHGDASEKYEEGKIVVKHTNGQRNHFEGILTAFTAQKNDNPDFFDKVYNCNPESKAEMIPFLDYKEIYG